MADDPKPFRLAVAGSRHLRDGAFIAAKLSAMLANRLPNVELGHGGFEGADALADVWALEHLTLPPIILGLGSKGAGKGVTKAGSRELIEWADAVLAFPLHPLSLGTQDAIGRAVMTRKPVVAYWLVLDTRGRVVAVKRVNEYGRKPLSKDVLG